MEQEKIVFERDKLYLLVWSKPMIHLAKDFGISDVGLRKICKKLEIPLPPAGFWIRKELNRPVKITPLPPLKKGNDTHTHFKREIYESEKLELTQETKALIDAELSEENKIHVPDSCNQFHHLVRKTIQSLRNDKWQQNGIASAGYECLDIRVSPALFQRAGLIMDTLVRELKKRKMLPYWSEENNHRGFFVNVRGEEISFRLTEKLNRTMYSESQIKKLYPNKQPWEIKKYEDIPSGNLVLTIKDSEYPGVYKRFKDQKSKRIEDQLNNFIVALYEYSDLQKDRRVKEAERQRQMRIEQEKAYEREERIRKENEKIKILLDQISSWQKSKTIREFADFYRQKLIQIHGMIEAGSAPDQYLTWVNTIADRFDPFVEKSYT